MDMLKDRKTLENKLILYLNNVETAKIRQNWYIKLSKEYGIPINISSDIISGRKDLSEYNLFELFAITSVVKNEYINEYFTPAEIKLFKDQKYKEKQVNRSFQLPMIKVANDQYIGATTVKFLMELRDAQLINYNAETQRALERMLAGENVVYRPYINARAVEEIADAYKDGKFIPNTISLNISEDDINADYYYSEKDRVLVINNITAFDIFDGYHRYLGMARVYDLDHDFDAPMELRITTFSVSKAKQFIFQEDHKTKMRVVDAKSYDQRNGGNVVVGRLQSDTSCYLFDKIALRGGLIDSAVLGQIITKLYFPKKPDTQSIIQATKSIKTRLNSFVEQYDEYISKEWTVRETYLIIYGIFKEYDNKKIYDAVHNDLASIVTDGRKLNNKTLKDVKEVFGDE